MYYRPTRREKLRHWWVNRDIIDRLCLVTAFTIGLPISLPLLLAFAISKGLGLITDEF